ncbi:hypothetical protein Pst134EA_019012 [Puccinia striiformis f. sp. tritici]|uniref:hypothetical protein n=1 Tax=Puccinia striiformis f. sp. tritici TaxID=168172 RepID=UPI0020085A82|nr:hypothetical protein Pst134EA_019012 [Puccinia striiformis f. sp. tritici]KAH9449081.1 hypothetical protein Pst134EB_019916 [Puccinia striiformis f. sp. tritici]KAH9458858.1 hypothetical protein Pst134EA_019012 [Puccinia striiformis f. sp. tritici]
MLEIELTSRGSFLSQLPDHALVNIATRTTTPRSREGLCYLVDCAGAVEKRSSREEPSNDGHKLFLYWAVNHQYVSL